MKNLTLIALFTVVIASFIACGSDGATQNSSSTETGTTVAQAADAVAAAATSATDQVAENLTDNVAAANEASEEITKEMADKINASGTAIAEKKDKLAQKVSQVTERTSSKASNAVNDKVKEVKEADKNVEQKQKPSVKDVEVNNPPRPSGKVINTNNTSAPTTPPASTKPPVVKDPVKTKTTTETGAKKVLEKKVKEIQANPIHKHSDWNALLKKYVSSTGKVNYKGFKSDGAKLDKYLKTLADNPIESSWSRAEKMAYWINAYNAFTVKLIVNNYPVKKITDLEGGKPWDKKWIKLGSKTYSLNNIENDILRPTYKDARIHFAVNCAAKSCPPLLNKAWTKSNLESNFERQAKAFINNSSYNKVGNNKIEISKIFEWYAVDFGDIVKYINKYASTKAAGNAEVKYMEYDWNLNE